MIQVTTQDFELPKVVDDKQVNVKPRKLSMQAEKWASDELLVVELLRREDSLVQWMRSILHDQATDQQNMLNSTKDLHVMLSNGIYICQVMRALVDPNININTKYSSTMQPWKERENIGMFLKSCRSIGIKDDGLFCSEDLYSGSNMISVVFGLHYVALYLYQGKYTSIDIRKMESHEYSSNQVQRRLEKLQMDNIMTQLLHQVQHNPLHKAIPTTRVDPDPTTRKVLDQYKIAQEKQINTPTAIKPSILSAGQYCVHCESHIPFEKLNHHACKKDTRTNSDFCQLNPLNCQFTNPVSCTIL